MTQIVLTAEQARMLSEATGPVEFTDPDGRTLGTVTPLTKQELEMIARAKQARAKGEAGIPSARVQAMMQHLTELDRRGEATEDNVREVLRRVKAGEPL